MPKKKQRKAKGRMPPLARHENQCDVCGAAENDKTIYSFGIVTLAHFEDREQFLAYAHSGDADLRPALTGSHMFSQCPHHTDEEILAAGFIPHSMVGKLPGLREAITEAEAKAENGAAPDWSFEGYKRVRASICVHEMSHLPDALLAEMLEASSEIPEARELLETYRAETLLHMTDPDIQA
jgi:hypothetical protein